MKVRHCTALPNYTRLQALLHTYYSIPLDISNVRVSGLDGVKYIDKLDAAAGDKTGEPSFAISSASQESQSKSARGKSHIGRVENYIDT